MQKTDEIKEKCKCEYYCECETKEKQSEVTHAVHSLSLCFIPVYILEDYPSSFY